MKIFTLIAIALISVSCSSSKPSATKINALEVTEKLVKGQTTQAQVLENFGAPDVVEKTPEGDMWAYNRQNSESNSTGGGFTQYIPTGYFYAFSNIHAGSENNTSSTNSASLVLFFSAKKVLRTYTYRTEKF
jgi:hypothetical protein